MKKPTTSLLLILLILNNRAYGWVSSFTKNRETTPSIKIQLEPPEKPYPQVTEMCASLESGRKKMEEQYWSLIKNAFDKELDISKAQFEKSIQKALSVLTNPTKINSALKATPSASSSSFREIADFDISEKGRPLEAPPMFLKDVLNTLTNAMGNINPATVEVQLLDVNGLDDEIGDKIKAIEQARSKEQASLLESGKKIFQNITKLTILELEKNLQINLNPFLVDSSKLGNSLIPSSSSFRELESEVGGAVFTSEAPPNFVAVDSIVSPGQLNVGVGMAEGGYPTVVDLVDDFQKRRDATERLQRTRLLQMYLHLMRAQIEMIKDVLHFEVSKSLSLWGGAFSS